MDTAESVVVLGFGITFMENPLVGLLGGMELVSEQTTLQNSTHVPCLSNLPNNKERLSVRLSSP